MLGLEGLKTRDSPNFQKYEDKCKMQQFDPSHDSDI